MNDIKDFLAKCKTQKAKVCKIKVAKTKSGAKVTKFKLRCPRYLYTFVVQDAEKAKKLRQSLPPKLEVQDLDKSA